MEKINAPKLPTTELVKLIQMLPAEKIKDALIVFSLDGLNMTEREMMEKVMSRTIELMVANARLQDLRNDDPPF